MVSHRPILRDFYGANLMPRQLPQRFEFEQIRIDPFSPRTKRQQLEEQFRDSIRRGSIQPGEKLPSSRSLSQMLGVSRNTIMQAYEQLLTEGYLEARVGDGTRVSAQFPQSRAHPSGQRRKRPGRPRLSVRGRTIAKFGSAIPPWKGPTRPFRPHLPALDVFPRQIWERLSNRRLKRMPRETLRECIRWDTGRYARRLLLILEPHAGCSAQQIRL